MKKLILCLALLAGTAVHAGPVEDYVQNFAQLSALESVAQVYSICSSALSSWPSPVYAETIKAAAAAWPQSPDAAYKILRTCQDMWSARFMDPSKTPQLQDANEYAQLSFLMAAADFVKGAPYLRQEIRLFNRTQPPASASVPPAPYEILTGMASSEREMDETLHQKMRESYAALAGTVAALPIGVTALKDISMIASRGALVAARAAKQALIAWIVAEAVTTAVDDAIWYNREANLWAPLKKQIQDLRGQTTAAPAPVLLDQFYRSVEILGRFYSLSAYADGGKDETQPQGNSRCVVPLKNYFEGKTQPKQMASQFARGTLCRDAALWWIGASEFLHQQRPNDAQALQKADDLMAKAKRLYMSYQTARLYEATLPVCVYTGFDGLSYTQECLDPKTGQPVL